MTDILLFLIPLALLPGAIGLAAFFWTLKNGQHSDPEETAHHILIEDDED